MNTNDTIKNTQRDDNADPITGEPGSHPVSTGVGAAGAGATGAAIGGAVGGPVGAVIGAVVGAVAGGYGGKAVGEVIDSTAEDAYWREKHGSQLYAAPGTSFDDYHPAYRAGYEGFQAHGAKSDRFEDAEPELRRHYETSKPKLSWEQARDAARASWTRVSTYPSLRSRASDEQPTAAQP